MTGLGEVPKLSDRRLLQQFGQIGWILCPEDYLQKTDLANLKSALYRIGLLHS
jgi:hypothetical protein